MTVFYLSSFSLHLLKSRVCRAGNGKWQGVVRYVRRTRRAASPTDRFDPSPQTSCPSNCLAASYKTKMDNLDYYSIDAILADNQVSLSQVLLPRPHGARTRRAHLRSHSPEITLYLSPGRRRPWILGRR